MRIKVDSAIVSPYDRTRQRSLGALAVLFEFQRPTLPSREHGIEQKTRPQAGMILSTGCQAGVLARAVRASTDDMARGMARSRIRTVSIPRTGRSQPRNRRIRPGRPYRTLDESGGSEERTESWPSCSSTSCERKSSCRRRNRSTRDRRARTVDRRGSRSTLPREARRTGDVARETNRERARDKSRPQ